jgi:Pyridoxamine 5'-phosphate oxidase
MASATRHARSNEGIPVKEVSGPAAGDRTTTAASLTSEQVWRKVARASFAVLAYVTPRGQPRSSGVVYKAVGRRLYLTTAPDSWKARHIPTSKTVSVTVPVRRGGLLSLVAPIPPATISFQASAIVHPADSPEARSVIKELGNLVPPERRENASVIEVIPEGTFLTYAVGVPLRKMFDLTGARGRVAVG